MTRTEMTFEAMETLVGKELGVSEWVTVDQAMIDQFADCTRDHQWIHIDVERARRESPYGAPVAHGFLTLSLIAGMSYQVRPLLKGMQAAFNYGLDKVRFLAPVRAGARVRLRSTLQAFDPKGEGRYLMKSSNVVEIDGEDKPALVAESLAMLVKDPAGR